MSGTLNKVMLIGHLGDDVKMHYFEGGGSIGRFPLATNESYVNKTSGEKVTNTEWHNIVVRNKAAEVCEKYLVKEIKFTLKVELKQENGQVKMEMIDILSKSMSMNLPFFRQKKKQAKHQLHPHLDRQVLRRHLQMLKIYPFKNNIFGS